MAQAEIRARLDARKSKGSGGRRTKQWAPLDGHPRNDTVKWWCEGPSSVVFVVGKTHIESQQKIERQEDPLLGPVIIYMGVQVNQFHIHKARKHKQPRLSVP